MKTKKTEIKKTGIISDISKDTLARKNKEKKSSLITKYGIKVIFAPFLNLS